MTYYLCHVFKTCIRYTTRFQQLLGFLAQVKNPVEVIRSGRPFRSRAVDGVGESFAGERSGEGGRRLAVLFHERPAQ